MRLPSCPKDAQIYIDGICYKQGLHGLIYRWNNEEWVKANLTVEEFEKAVNGRVRTNQHRRSSLGHGNDRENKVVGIRDLSGYERREQKHEH